VAVVIRLARVGRQHVPHYRIVATEKHTPRDSKYLEIVGTYSPLSNPAQVTLREDRIRQWIENGAKATGAARDIIRKRIPGLVDDREKHQLAKIQARRKARKARAKGGAKSTTKAAPAKKAAPKTAKAKAS